MPTTQYPTLADQVLKSFSDFVVNCGILPAQQRLTLLSEEQLQQLREISVAWYGTIVYYSRQGSAVVEALTDEASLQRLVSQTAHIQMSPEALTESTGAIKLTLDLVELLTHPPTLKQDAKLLDQVQIGTVDFNRWIAEGACHWEQQDDNYSPQVAPVTDAVINLRSILLILKLISIALSEGRATGVSMTPIRILWQMQQKPLNHVTCCFDKVPSTGLAARGYGTARDQDNTQQACLLAAAIVRLMLPLIRTNLKMTSDHITEQCLLLRCLLLPQWGLPAAAAKDELLKSGTF